jgi:hypothetical protein
MEGERELFRKLRDILFEDEIKEHNQLAQAVQELHEDINTRQRLQTKVEPIVEDKLTYLKEHFPELFGPVIAEALAVQIKDSKEAIIDALYPIMGSLIKKYVVVEIEALSEKIDRQLDKVFSWEGWVARTRGWLAGTSWSQQMIRDALPPVIEEVFVIEQHSSILMGSYSRQHTLDRDMIAGMLTAIKGFVKDAFAQEHQELEMVAYETYKIVIKNFRTFYVAVTVSGVIDTRFERQLDNMLLDFASKFMNQPVPDSANQKENLLSELLQKHFTEPAHERK